MTGRTSYHEHLLRCSCHAPWEKVGHCSKNAIRLPRAPFWGYPVEHTTSTLLFFRAQSAYHGHLFSITATRAPSPNTHTTSTFGKTPSPMRLPRAPFFAPHSAYHEHLFMFLVRNPLTTGTFFQSRPHGHLRVILVPRAPFGKVLVGNLLRYHEHLFSNRNHPSTFAKGAWGSGIG